MRELGYLTESKDVTVVNKEGNLVSLGKVSMSIDELVRYGDSVLRETENVQRELDMQARDDQPYDR